MLVLNNQVFKYTWTCCPQHLYTNLSRSLLFKYMNILFALQTFMTIADGHLGYVGLSRTISGRVNINCLMYTYAITISGNDGSNSLFERQ